MISRCYVNVNVNQLGTWTKLFDHGEAVAVMCYTNVDVKQLCKWTKLIGGGRVRDLPISQKCKQ